MLKQAALQFSSFQKVEGNAPQVARRALARDSNSGLGLEGKFDSVLKPWLITTRGTSPKPTDILASKQPKKEL